MEILLCWTVGGLVTAGFYLLLNASLMRVLFGIILMSNAVNLCIFLLGGLDKITPALLTSSQSTDTLARMAPALPQALILTAIVISFSVITFVLVLIVRGWIALKTLTVDDLRSEDPTVS